MAVIRDELTLVDRFTSVFNRYINLGNQASSQASQVGTSASQMSDSISQTMIRATASLNGLTQEQASVQIEMSELNTVIRDQMTALGELDLAYLRATTSQGEASEEAQRLERQITELSNELDTNSREFADARQEMERTTQAANPLTNSIMRLAGAYLSLRGLKQAVNLSDELTGINGRLDVLVDDGGSVEALQARIRQSAEASRAEYTSVADSIVRLGTQTRGVFSGSEELIQFAEALNQQFAISRTSGQQAESAMFNLTQAMSTGILRGQDFNAVFSASPAIMNRIADYLGVSTGELRNLATQGQLSADVIKDALLGASDEIAAEFEELPYTFEQVWNTVSNSVLEALQPLFDGLSDAADWIGQNWSTIEPILVGVAAALLFVAAALAIQAAATWIANGAAQAFFVTLLTNPLTWIALVIGLVIGFIYRWVQSIGGLKNAWDIFTMAFQIAWTALQIAFFTGVYAVLNFLTIMEVAFSAAGVAIGNFMGDMKVNVLNILQNLVNGAIGIINEFIDVLNNLPGVSIEAISEVTFATTAAAAEDAARTARESGLDDLVESSDKAMQDRQQHIEDLKSQLDSQVESLSSTYSQMKADAAADTTPDLPDLGGYEPPSLGGAGGAGVSSGGGGSRGGGGNVGTVDRVGSVGSVDDVSLADEDLKMLRDIAEREYTAQVNVTNLSPEVRVEVNNTNGANLDENTIGNVIKGIIDSQVAAHSDGVYTN